MGKGSSEQTQTSTPWAAVTPYLTGQGGVMPEAQDLYQSQEYIGMTPEQQQLVQQQMGQVGGNQAAGVMQGIGQNTLAGQYDPTMAGLNMNAARAGQGALDPTGALQQALSGQPNMDVLGGMQQANSNQAMRGFQDMTDAAGRMFTEQINPAIRSGAINAGQYGGSRQGLAQGVAARDIGEQLTRSAENLGQASLDAGNQLYGNAYQNAQAQQAATGGMLNQQAFGTDQYNLARGDQNMQTMLQNQLTGAGAVGAGEAQQGQDFQQLYGLQGMGSADQQAQQDFDWNQLSNYANIAMPMGGMGGTTNTTTQNNPGLLSMIGTGMNIAGGVAGMPGIGSVFSGGGPTQTGPAFPNQPGMNYGGR